LRDLERSHNALNISYTFCSARRHLATTFDILKRMVEPHIGRPLTVQDVSCMAALRPKSIRFGYVDSAALRAELRGLEREPRQASGAEIWQPRQLEASEDQVLFFEFIDTELGKAAGCQLQSGWSMKMAAVNQKQLIKMIRWRDEKFRESVDLFVARCLDERKSIEKTLLEASNDHLPTPRHGASERTFSPKLAASVPATIPTDRSSIADIIDELTNSDWYCGQIVKDGRRTLGAREAVYGELTFLLSQELVDALFNVGGVNRFYSHQAEAFNHLYDGHNVVVATSTSSGKSLIYQLPVLHALQMDRNSRAMSVFPTKALAQDQMGRLQKMLAYLPGLDGTMIATLDGDTPMEHRESIRTNARILFTNPDMLHVSILPQEERWRSFLQNLRFFIVDELHSYCGVFGSHVAFVIRRLRRLCAAVGNDRVQFVAFSATMANPEEHFRAVVGVQDVHLVDKDGSPSGPKEFLCWNTPQDMPGNPRSGRASALLECCRLFCQLILRGVRTIAFCRSRVQCESLVGAIKQELTRLGREECARSVMGYRAGYTAEDRRSIEKQMFDGSLLGIVATSALELGIDIGTLDCVLMWGFPHSISNLRQQIGRAGRTFGKDSLAILVGDGAATDQHYMRHPDELFSQQSGLLHIDLENVLVREGHIQCAAAEMPLKPDLDESYFGPGLEDLCRERLVEDGHGFFHSQPRLGPSPALQIDIRDTDSEEKLAIIDITGGKNEVLEELEMWRATFTVYEGGIYLHQGNQYIVRDFQPERQLARVERVQVDWATTPRDYTDIDPIRTEASQSIAGSQARAFYGMVKVEQRVFGFFRKNWRGKIIETVDVDNAPMIRHRKGMWLDVPGEVLDLLRRRLLNVPAAIHAVEHVLMSLIPTCVANNGKPGDVRIDCKNTMVRPSTWEARRKRPGRLAFYDAKGGACGSGMIARAFEFVDVLLQKALERIINCGCDRGQGCLECVASKHCQESNEVVSRGGAMVVIMGLLGQLPDEAELPIGPEDTPTGGDTMTLARTMPADVNG
jgi:DEAD/DEAH box helicase domain-containing protein